MLTIMKLPRLVGSTLAAIGTVVRNRGFATTTALCLIALAGSIGLGFLIHPGRARFPSSTRSVRREGCYDVRVRRLPMQSRRNATRGMLPSVRMQRFGDIFGSRVAYLWPCSRDLHPDPGAHLQDQGHGHVHELSPGGGDPVTLTIGCADNTRGVINCPGGGLITVKLECSSCMH